jgi:hypothetical protein
MSDAGSFAFGVIVGTAVGVVIVYAVVRPRVPGIVGPIARNAIYHALDRLQATNYVIGPILAAARPLVNQQIDTELTPAIAEAVRQALP